MVGDTMTLYDIEQDALDAAIEYPYELSPQQMVDKLIELMIMVKVEPDDEAMTKAAVDAALGDEPTDLWNDKTIADAESLLEDSDENRDLVADILAVAARQFDVVPEGEQR